MPRTVENLAVLDEIEGPLHLSRNRWLKIDYLKSLTEEEILWMVKKALKDMSGPRYTEMSNNEFYPLARRRLRYLLSSISSGKEGE